MRAIVTGQVGMDKKPYLERRGPLRRVPGRVDPHIYHVGDMMYAEAPTSAAGASSTSPLPPQLPPPRRVQGHHLRVSATMENMIVNTHATFRWRHGLFSAFDFDQIQRSSPTCSSAS
jgi:adenylate kinase